MAAAEGVELAAELLQQRGVVRGVGRRIVVAGVPLTAGRELPVDVEPVEDAGRDALTAGRVVAERWQVAPDVHVDTRADEGAARLRGRRHVGEVLGVGPPTE